MTVTNHWGMWVDSTMPVTGVISNNNVEWLNDEIYSSTAINLDYERWLNDRESEVKEDEDLAEDEDVFLDIEDEYESNGDDTILIGEWLMDNNGKYYPDPNGDYAAIVGEFCTQVVFSKYFSKGNLCSPCYPGQVDLDSEGEFLGYTFPPEIIGFNS